jgi:hypothetical protein
LLLRELGQGTIGDVKMTRDDSAGALAAYQANLAIAERLANLAISERPVDPATK